MILKHLYINKFLKILIHGFEGLLALLIDRLTYNNTRKQGSSL